MNAPVSHSPWFAAETHLGPAVLVPRAGDDPDVLAVIQIPESWLPIEMRIAAAMKTAEMLAAAPAMIGCLLLARLSIIAAREEIHPAHLNAQDAVHFDRRAVRMAAQFDVARAQIEAVLAHAGVPL